MLPRKKKNRPSKRTIERGATFVPAMPALRPLTRETDVISITH